MKKVVFFVFIALSAASCKKVYQCECTQVQNGETWNPYKTSFPIEETKKKDAETICKSQSYSLGWQDYRSCDLKN
ncbi:MAG: hypothetical protein ACO1O6_12135 [Bacteroidota bacterium]